MVCCCSAAEDAHWLVLCPRSCLSGAKPDCLLWPQKPGQSSGMLRPPPQQSGISICNACVVRAQNSTHHVCKRAQFALAATDIQYNVRLTLCVHGICWCLLRFTCYIKHTGADIWNTPVTFCAMQAGHCVLVHSAAGGCGLNALAICLAVGAVPIGTVGSQNKVCAPP